MAPIFPSRLGFRGVRPGRHGMGRCGPRDADGKDRIRLPHLNDDRGRGFRNGNFPRRRGFHGFNRRFDRRDLAERGVGVEQQLDLFLVHFEEARNHIRFENRGESQAQRNQIGAGFFQGTPTASKSRAQSRMSPDCIEILENLRNTLALPLDVADQVVFDQVDKLTSPLRPLQVHFPGCLPSANPLRCAKRRSCRTGLSARPADERWPAASIPPRARLCRRIRSRRCC